MFKVFARVLAACLNETQIAAIESRRQHIHFANHGKFVFIELKKHDARSRNGIPGQVFRVPPEIRGIASVELFIQAEEFTIGSNGRTRATVFCNALGEKMKFRRLGGSSLFDGHWMISVTSDVTGFIDVNSHVLWSGDAYMLKDGRLRAGQEWVILRTDVVAPRSYFKYLGRTQFQAAGEAAYHKAQTGTVLTPFGVDISHAA
ncbi:hypothetical protein CL614_00720 [archaeon]|nr:hypothetical protein [archaeon]|tara:strand:- start:1341 stop:1949 length:609 start_codon:yes stop_codon:yes gene_type:complete